MNEIANHYDKLIESGNDPVNDPKPLRDYMDKWDGQDFIDCLQLDKTKSVLEVGVGTGRLAVKIAPLCKLFVGIDLSPKTVQRALYHLSDCDNVNIVCDDFLTAKFNQKFDIIYSSLTFMHIENKQYAIRKVYKLLNDNGIFALSVDKNQCGVIDAGFSNISDFPDDPTEIENFITVAGLTVVERYETEFTNIFITRKYEITNHRLNRWFD